MQRRLMPAVVACGLLLAPPAIAQEVSDAARSAARSLGYEGIEAYRAGDYATASEKLGRAYAVVMVPTVGLWLARSLVKIGKLVEASERYGEVSRTQVTEGQVEAQKRAQEAAAKERVELQQRIPTVRIKLKGASVDEVEVRIDGIPLPPALVDVPSPVNPGKRTIEGKRGDHVVTQTVDVQEAQRLAIELDFATPTAATAAPVTGSALPPSPSDDEPDRAPAVPADATQDSNAETGSAQRTIGWVGIGVGAVGLATWGITGAFALYTKGSISDDCVDNECLSSSHDDISTYNTMRTVSTIGFIVGAVGTLGGATLLLTAPDADPSEAKVRAWVGVGSAGVAGTF